MKILFEKYHGTGNDFIMLDNRTGLYASISEKQVEFLCNRHFGIGADGLILLEKEADIDFKMVYYNSDGRISSMCGNGGRCIVAFAKSMGIMQNETRFIAIDGMHEATVESENPVVVKLKMKNVDEVEQIGEDLFLNTGSPHYVRFVNNTLETDVLGEGRRVRNSDRFKKDGTNVNFVQTLNDRLIVRSYERGVEDETLSCGTGIVASALASVSSGKIKQESGFIKIKALGGSLKVHFEKAGNGFKNIWLEGEATYVFKGEIEI